ncbi:MAG TPA: EamA family transporter [Thermoanaerobaculia bacterium]
MIRLAAEAVAALLLFGCIPVVVKFIAANPYTIGVFRLAIATIGLGCVMLVRRQLQRVAPRDLAKLAAIGFLFFAHWLTLFFGIKVSSASIGAIGLSTYGVHLLLLGALVTRQRPTIVTIAAVLIAATGAMLVVPAFTLGNATALGMALSSLSALFYASLPILHQRWSHLPSATRALGQFGFALLFFLFFLPKTRWDLAPRDWAGLLFLAIGVTLIAHSLWVRVTTRLSSTTTAVIYYGNIPIAVLLGVLVLDEPLTVRTVMGGAMIIGGSVLGLLARNRDIGPLRVR